MNAPGHYTLGVFPITAASTYVPEAASILDGLDGMTAASVQIMFSYGSGGTSAVIYVQTSLDNGMTWMDIAAIAVTTSSETHCFNFSGLTPKATSITPSDGAMSNDTALDGFLGDRLRLKIVSVGTYANTIVTGAVVVR
ncbi:MAG: hypothetical protein AB7F35_06410 [Acetobacteraceae bacterium]